MDVGEQVRVEGERCLRLLALVDVGEHGEVSGELAAVVEDGGGADEEPAQVAVARLEPDVVVGVHAAPALVHACRLCGAVGRGEELLGCPADHLVRRVAEPRGERLVHEGHRVLGVADRDAFVGGGDDEAEALLRDAERLFGAGALEPWQDAHGDVADGARARRRASPGLAGRRRRT